MFDITDLVKDGENIITVRVDHHSPNSRWYSGAGIFRKVWLCESPEIRFGNDGIYITTSKQEDGWLVTVNAEMLRPEGTPLGESASGTLFLTRTAKRWQAMSLTLVGRIFPAYLRRCV